jgi:hypothetical protein
MSNSSPTISTISPVTPPPSIGMPTAASVGIDEVKGMFDWMDGKIDQVITVRVIILLVVVIFLGYFVVNALAGGTSENDTKESTLFANVSILEIFLWAILIVIVVLNGFQYFFNTNISTEITNLMSTKPKITISQAVPKDPKNKQDLGVGPSLKMKKQVFHIPSNVYDYNDAKALCQAYDAQIANIDQIEEAYKSGAEWCSYGWSDKQMILYPTQKSTWDELQKSTDPVKKNSCGRPGINGGFMNDASLKVGVNCYGPKPDMNEPSSRLMAQSQSVDTGKMLNPEQDARVMKMREKIKDIVIAPFNKSAWSLL